MNRKWLYIAIIGALLFGLAEGSSYVVGRILQKRLVFYNQPSIATYDNYMAERHPTLGWPSKQMLAEKYDASGSRPIPAFPDPGNACVSLYGDSYTWGDAADDTQAWSNQLAKLLNCRVANYGVPGYGMDQALLRFEENANDEAPVVLLNLFSGDIRRHVNQMRNFISDDAVFLLKPRFILDNNELRLIPLPTPTRGQAQLLITDPGQVLKHEYFMFGGPAGIQRLQFPYSLSLLSAFNNEHVQAKLTGATIWSKFYEPDHPSQALDLTAAIMRRFIQVTKERGKTPILTIIPNAHDIELFRETGQWSYSPLLTQLDAARIAYLNMGDGILEHLQGRSPCELTEKICYGHYDARGYAVVAKVVASYLEPLKKNVQSQNEIARERAG